MKDGFSVSYLSMLLECPQDSSNKDNFGLVSEAIENSLAKSYRFQGYAGQSQCRWKVPTKDIHFKSILSITHYSIENAMDGQQKL